MIGRLRRLLQSAASTAQLHQIHGQLIVTGLAADPFLAGNLLSSFLRLSRSLPYALLLLLFSTPSPSPFMYNSIFHSLLSSSLPSPVPSLFLRMRHVTRTPPNRHTFPLLLKAYSRLRLDPRPLHSSVLKLGFGSDPFVQPSLVSSYSYSARDARRAFQECHAPGVACWTALLHACSRAGDFVGARNAFDEMPLRNAVSWAAMISACVNSRRFEQAVGLFREMMFLAGKGKIGLVASVFVSVLVAVAELGALAEGMWVHAYLLRAAWKDWSAKLVSSLISMYCKCGDLACARQTFDRSDAREVDVWNAMITGLGLHGRGRGALGLFARMVEEDVEVDDLTFVGVLSACSHSGLVEEGRACFDAMSRLHGFEPKVEHYSCMVDLLGRAGLLTEATELIRSMPMEPNTRIWGSLFAACRIHNNVELGEEVGKRLIALEPDRAGRYLLLANLYASRGRYEDSVNVRESIKRRGLELEPGCSLVETDGEVHEFLVGDRTHPKTREIYNMLDEIERKLSLRCHVVDTRHALFDISEEEKERVLSWHSEKLAIAFGLISTRSREVIRIIKNLRICGDCHSMAKAVSDAYDREIVIRDRSRFHHFRQGSCSCSDYW